MAKRAAPDSIEERLAENSGQLEALVGKRFKPDEHGPSYFPLGVRAKDDYDLTVRNHLEAVRKFEPLIAKCKRDLEMYAKELCVEWDSHAPEFQQVLEKDQHSPCVF